MHTHIWHMFITYHLSVYCENILTKSSSSTIWLSWSTSSNSDPLDICIASSLSCPSLYNRIPHHVNHEKFSVHICIIYVRNSYSSHSPQKIWNDIHHLYGVFFYVCTNFSYFYKHFHISHTDMHSSHNRSFCDTHNSSYSETQYHTSYNTIPENMWHVVKMIKMNIYTKSWYWSSSELSWL